MKVLFVCTGNINRSAAAEMIARAVAPEIETRSAACNGEAGRSMPRRMREALADAGIPVLPHRSTALTADLVAWADLTVGMQPSHLRAVAKFGGAARSMVEWASTPLTKVPDPQFGGAASFPLVVQILLDAVPRLCEEMGGPR